MDESLRVGHVALFHLGDGHLQRAVPPHSLDLGIDHRVPVVVRRLEVRMTVNEVLLQPGQLGIDELLLHLFFLSAREVQVRGEEEGIGQKGGDVIHEQGETLASHQRLAHHLHVAQEAHDHQRHVVVVIVNVGRQARRHPVVQHQSLGLEDHAVPRQRPRFTGVAQVWKSLFDHAALRRIVDILDDEHLVEVAVPHFGSRETRVQVEDVRHRRAPLQIIDDGLGSQCMIGHNDYSLSRISPRRGYG